MFVCNGENIYPGEVEKLVETHPEVREASVAPAECPVRGQIPIAFVVKAQNATVSEGDIKQYVLDRAPAYMHPRGVRFMDELPLAGPGKIDRKLLKKLAADVAASGS